MNYWFNKSISDILFMIDNASINNTKISIEGKLMRKTYTALNILDKIAVDLTHDVKKQLTEFISITNYICDSLTAKKDSIFGPMYYVGYINDFQEKAKRLWDINNSNFIQQIKYCQNNKLLLFYFNKSRLF